VADIEYAIAEDGTHLAYRVLEPDPEHASEHSIVMVTGGLIPMEVFDEDAGIVRMLDGLRSIGRVVIFDRRGLGLSDPITSWDRPVLDQWSDDLAAVIDASGSAPAVVYAWDSFGVATRLAARKPDAIARLVLFQPMGGDEWWSWVHERIKTVQRTMRGEEATDLLTQIVPSRARDAAFRDWYERAGRVGASPATAARIWESVLATHAEQTLPDVPHPSLVLHRPNSLYVPHEAVHFVVDHLVDAVEVEIDGVDHWPFVGDVDAVVAEIAEFTIGERRVPPPDRVLAAVLFTDLVDSTRRAADVGDASWKALLDRHDRCVRNAVHGCGGEVIKTTGDGVLALLPSAGVAVRAARRIRDGLRAEDLNVRVGIHVGDVDRRGDDVSGLAVNIAARVMAKAATDEIAVTASVVAATAGQVSVFTPLGAHELKGIPGTWELFRLDGD